MNKIFFISFLICTILSCNNKEEILIGVANIPDCKRLPSYFNALGMNPSTSGFTTSENKKVGVCLVDFSTPENNKKLYQDSSWTKQGGMGPIAIDETGNVFVAPVPFVNVLHNKREDQNKLFYINATTGKLDLLIDLGSEKQHNEKNGFGILGMNYDCSSKLLYVTSIHGSNAQKEQGVIYCINPKTNPATIVDKIENIDAMGIGIAFFNDKKRCFFGSARDHNIYSVLLDDDGKFKGKQEMQFSLLDVGPRGDDVAKKIRFNEKGEMILTTVEFFYNLTAPTQKQESVYTYKYDLNENTWQKIKEENKNLIMGY